jgi:hypothetical protein
MTWMSAVEFVAVVQQIVAPSGLGVVEVPCPAAFVEPILNGLAGGVRARGLEALVDLAAQLGEPVCDRSLGLAGHLAPVAPAVGVVPEADLAPPAADTVMVVPGVPALGAPGVVKVDGVRPAPTAGLGALVVLGSHGAGSLPLRLPR